MCPRVIINMPEGWYAEKEKRQSRRFPNLGRMRLSSDK